MSTKQCFEHNFLNYFKIVLGVACIIGFLSQGIIFLKFYYSPASFLDIRIEEPEKFVFPALTFCNANLVSRTKFCANFSERCEAPPNMQAFCDRYPQYCTKYEDPLEINKSWKYDKNFLLPNKEVLWERDTVLTEDLQNFTQNVSTIVFTSVEEEDLAGPYFYVKPVSDRLIPCYTQHARIDSQLEPFLSFSAPFKDFAWHVSNYPTMVRTLSLKVEPAEYLDAKMKPGAYFALHSPYEAVNPQYKGVFMEPGKTYHIFLQLEEDHIIPSTENNCIDYIKRWENNGKKGPRSQQMCLEKCKYEYNIATDDCVTRSIMYPTQRPKCLFERESRVSRSTKKDPADELRRCKSSCPNECSKLRFHYSVEERPAIEHYLYDETWKLIYINIYLDEPHITVKSYKFPMKIVDSCSIIGGFMAFWICIFLLFTFIAQLLHKYIVSCFSKNQSTVSS